jgi:hypothetical protein
VEHRATHTNITGSQWELPDIDIAISDFAVIAQPKHVRPSAPADLYSNPQPGTSRADNEVIIGHGDAYVDPDSPQPATVEQQGRGFSVLHERTEYVNKHKTRVKYATITFEDVPQGADAQDWLKGTLANLIEYLQTSDITPCHKVGMRITSNSAPEINAVLLFADKAATGQQKESRSWRTLGPTRLTAGPQASGYGREWRRRKCVRFRLRDNLNPEAVLKHLQKKIIE